MKKKIIYCDKPLASPGGGQVSLLTLVSNLNRDEFEPLVFLSEEGEYAQWLKDKNIAYTIVSVKNLFKRLKEETPDVIHCNAATTKYTFFCALIANRLNIPFIWHVRVTEECGWKDRMIGNLATKIIVISQAVKEKFSWIKEKGKVCLIYNAVDRIIIHPDCDIKYLHQEFSPAKDEKIIGIFSRIEDWKGHLLFVEAAKKLVDKGGKYKFLVVGDGFKLDTKKVMDKICEYQLNDRFCFTGYRNDVPSLMNFCDVVVSPSISPEPFGRTIIEAMSCGKPVVATNLGGPKEIIENGVNGFLTDTKSEEIAECIDHVCHDSEAYARISRQAINTVIEKFSIVQQVNEVQSIYTEVLGNAE